MTQPSPRRVLLMTLATSTAALGTLAHAPTLLDEKEPQAVALDYVADAKRAAAHSLGPNWWQDPAGHRDGGRLHHPPAAHHVERQASKARSNSSTSDPT